VSTDVALAGPARNGAAGALPRAPGPPVRAQGLTVERGGAQVLSDLSCAAPAGRLTVVTGPSGSGKTTLLRALAGLATVQSGVVSIGDAELSGLDPERRAALRRRLIGYLPQEPAPVGFLSASENVALTLRLRGWETRAASARAGEILEALGLRERARQRVSRLSAGEAQRVALARALAPGAGVVIADEPTSRLDRPRAQEIADLLARTAAHERQTVICASHDPDLIERADHTIELGDQK